MTMPFFSLELPCDSSKNYILLILIKIIDSNRKSLMLDLEFFFPWFGFTISIEIKIIIYLISFSRPKGRLWSNLRFKSIWS